jgi:hypothetical protein
LIGEVEADGCQQITRAPPEARAKVRCSIDAVGHKVSFTGFTGLFGIAGFNLVNTG